MIGIMWMPMPRGGTPQKKADRYIRSPLTEYDNFSKLGDIINEN